MKMMGDDKWNNGSANSGASRTRVLIYDPNPEGRLPK
jgi:type IV pilus assembly protein PilY1